MHASNTLQAYRTFQQTFHVNLFPFKWQFALVYWTLLSSFQGQPKTHQTCLHRMVATAQNRRQVENEEVQVLYRES